MVTVLAPDIDFMQALAICLTSCMSFGISRGALKPEALLLLSRIVTMLQVLLFSVIVTKNLHSGLWPAQ